MQLLVDNQIAAIETAQDSVGIDKLTANILVKIGLIKCKREHGILRPSVQYDHQAVNSSL